jgi:hypothetical protein
MSEFWRDHGTLALSAGTAVGYVVGYASVAAIAAVLSVTAQDLGLDFRDYLLLAGVNTCVWALLVAAPLAALLLGTLVSEAMRKTWPRGGYRDSGWTFLVVMTLVCIVPLGIILAATYVSFGTLSGPGLIISMVAYVLALAIPVGALALVIGAREGFRATPVSELAESELTDRTAVLGVDLLAIRVALLSILAASSIMMVAGAIDWANRVEDWAHTGGQLDARPSAPPALALLLRPEVGEATATVGPRTVESCGIRIGSDVYLGAQSASVARDVVLFSVETCRLPDSPFD